MKRKFKLFATVASLCLCLALMAFGVYAATTVTYTAKGSVKYTVADVFVDFETTTYGSNTKGVGRSSVSNDDSISWGSALKTYGKVSSYDGTTPDAAGQDGSTETTALDAMDFKDHDAYKVVIKVSNKAKSGKVRVTGQVSFTEEKNFTVVSADTYTEEEIVSGANKEFIFYVLLNDPTASIEEKEKDSGVQPFTITLTVENSSVGV